MPLIDIDDQTYERLVLSARLLDLPVGRVVSMLVDRLLTEALTSPPSPAPIRPAVPPAAVTAPLSGAAGPRDVVSVFAVYLGRRVTGRFDPSSLTVAIDDAPWNGKVFPSPTAAAIAVVRQLAPDERQSANTNGRIFWKSAHTGKDLRSIIGVRL